MHCNFNAELITIYRRILYLDKQEGEDRVWSRIDGAFGNCDWMMCWGRIVLEYDLRNISNHAPML